DPHRSGVGRLGARPDLAMLALVLTFGAFANAGGMIAPAQTLNAWVGSLLGTTAPAAVQGAVFLAALVALPVLVVGLTAAGSRLLAGRRENLVRTATRFAYGLVPLGFGMWVGHYLYHFLGSGLTLVPVLQQFFVDRGAALLGQPDWTMGALVPAGWLEPIEILALEGGLLVSLAVLYGIARRTYGRAARRAFAPWAVVALLLGTGGAWLLSQPMQMRGMEMPGTEMPGMRMPGSQMPDGDMQRTEMPDMQTSQVQAWEASYPPGAPGAGGSPGAGAAPGAPGAPGAGGARAARGGAAQ
ncbi:MAG TPA: hypothetical protein VJ957_02575, partial [Longimicrobiales bacterium]|nr:hypothetical protein [Longimicrobiales bacterium]